MGCTLAGGIGVERAICAYPQAEQRRASRGPARGAGEWRFTVSSAHAVLTPRADAVSGVA